MGKEVKWYVLNDDGGYDLVRFITIRLSKLNSVRCASLIREDHSGRAWLKCGKLHRYYGPAVMDETYVWYIDGYRIKEYDIC